MSETSGGVSQVGVVQIYPPGEVVGTPRFNQDFPHEQFRSKEEESVSYFGTRIVMLGLGGLTASMGAGAACRSSHDDHPIAVPDSVYG